MSRSWTDDVIARPNRRQAVRFLMLASVGASITACGAARPEPRRIRWGRDTCEFCHMTLADRRFAAEVWDPELGRARIYDDFGCAIMAANATETGLVERADIAFWVADEADPSVWLDARTARFRDDATTPMGYGHSAGRSPAHRLDFAAAARGVRQKAICEPRA